MPKASRWEVHFFGLNNTLGPTLPLELDPDISPNLLLARFASAVFPVVSQFLNVGAGRKLRLRVMGEGGLKEVIKTVKAQEMAVMGWMRGRSLSPKKMENATETPAAESRTVKRQRLSSPSNSTARDPSQNVSILGIKQNSQMTKTYTNRALNLRDDSTAKTPSSNLPSPPSPRAHALWSSDPNPNIAVSASCVKAMWIKSRRPSNPDL